MVWTAVLIPTFSSGIHTHPVSWNCAYRLRMESSDGGWFPNLVRNCRWTIVLRQSFWIALYVIWIPIGPWTSPRHSVTQPEVACVKTDSKVLVPTIYRVILSLEAPNAIRQEIQAVNVDTLGKVFQNLEKRIQVWLDVKREQFQHWLWAGPVFHRCRCVYTV